MNEDEKTIFALLVVILITILAANVVQLEAITRKNEQLKTIDNDIRNDIDKLGNFLKDEKISEEDLFDYFYSDENKHFLILEQNVAAHRGNNVLYDILTTDYNFSYNETLYNAWLETREWIDNNYYLEFDEFGNISFCEYNHEVDVN